MGAQLKFSIIDSSTTLHSAWRNCALKWVLYRHFYGNTMGQFGAWTTDTRRLNLIFLGTQIDISLLNEYLGLGYRGSVFFRNNGWILENMDKELTVSLLICNHLEKWFCNMRKVSNQKKIQVCRTTFLESFFLKSGCRLKGRVPKWVLIVQLKIPQMPQKGSAQNVFPSPKVWDF